MAPRVHPLVFTALVSCGNSVSAPPASPSPAVQAPVAAASITPPASAPVQSATASAPKPAPAAVAELVAKTVPLPGATGPVTLDYIAYDRTRARVWVPVGARGSGDGFDIASGTFTRVDGFKTGEGEH